MATVPAARTAYTAPSEPPLSAQVPIDQWPGRWPGRGRQAHRVDAHRFGGREEKLMYAAIRPQNGFSAMPCPMPASEM